MSRPKGYLVNIAWTWLGFVLSLVYGFVVFPKLMRYLGKETYGVWELAAGLVESLWLIDIGFRAATVKLSAEFHALDRNDDINRLINTALMFSVSAGALLGGAAWLGADGIAAYYSQTIQDPTFPFLIRCVAISFAGGLIFNVFAAVLEGFHRFDLSTRCMIVRDLLRTGLTFGLIGAGYGLPEMGLILLFSYGLCYFLMWFYCRSVFPAMRLSPALASREMGSRVWAYVKQVAFAMMSDRVTNFAIPAGIGKMMAPEFIGYWGRLRRLPDYGGDIVGRVGLVTSPRTSGMFARGELAEIVSLTRYANRYCLTIWGCAAAYLFVYGAPFCRVWVTREFGDQAGVVLPYLAIAYTLWMGQFVSASVLMGIARYKAYSTAVLIESVCEVAAVFAILPKYGLQGVAIVVSTGLALVRGLFLARCFAHEFKLPYAKWLGEVYALPLSLILASTGGLWFLRERVVPGANWPQVLGVAVAFSIVYFAAALVIVVPAEHRKVALERLRSRF